MAEFFQSLKAIEKVFLISATLGGAVFLVRLILFFIGLGHHDIDTHGELPGDTASIDGHHGDTESSFKFISLQSVTAFFMMFGLVGLALSKQSQWTESLSVLGAMAGGTFSVWVIGKLFSSMQKLQSEGTLDIRNAIGKEGTVYLTIPATGKGIVQIAVQDSLRELTAVSQDKTQIKTGERVIVEDISGGNILVVRKV